MGSGPVRFLEAVGAERVQASSSNVLAKWAYRAGVGVWWYEMVMCSVYPNGAAMLIVLRAPFGFDTTFYKFFNRFFHLGQSG